MTVLFTRLARRYLLGRKGRSVMTLLGIALGVTMVVAVLLTNSAILASYENLLSAAAGRADLQISGLSGGGFPQAILEEVRTTTGMKAAAPVVTSAAPVAFGVKQAGATIYGVIFDQDRQIRDYRLTAGMLPGSNRQIAVTADLANSLGMKPGDELQVLTTKGMQGFRVTGILDSAGTVRGSLGPFGVMTLPDAQAAFGKEGKLDLIDLRVAEGQPVDRVRAELAATLADRVRVGTPVERSKDMQGVLDGVIFVLTMAGSISLFAGAFIIYTNVAMGVAERRRDLSILRALGMKRGEVMALVLAEAGLLGLLGAAIGLVWGYGMASFMARQMTGQFLSVYGLQAAEVTLTAAAAAAAFAVGVGAALVAALAPARETVMVSPVDAMRPAEPATVERRRYGSAFATNVANTQSWLRAGGGIALMVAAAAFIWLTWPEKGMLPPLMLRTWGVMLVVCLLGMVLLLPTLLGSLHRWLFRPLLGGLFGVSGRLAADNLVRQPRRTAATICALMVSLSFMVGLGGVSVSQRKTFDNWFAKAVGWDMNVSSSFVGIGAQVEMDATFNEDMARVEGIRLVSPQKMIQVVLEDDASAFMQVFDHLLLRQYSEIPLARGEWNQVADQMERGGAIIISEAVAHRLGVSEGGRVTLRTPSGPATFTVAGVMIDITSFGGTVQLDRADYVRLWKDETATNYAVLVEKGADPAEVKARLMAKWGESKHLNIRLNREFWAELKGLYDGFYQMMDGLIWIAVLVSGLAIANTLFASILERRREFGMLRAVGTRRREVMQVVVGEALATGMIGGAFGMVAGLAMEWVMGSSSQFITGASTTLVIPWGPIGLAAAVALLAAPAVGFLPARWAARLDVVEALRYE